jgi:hypothetical protein
VESPQFPLIHIGFIQTHKGKETLYLRMVAPYRFVWFLDEKETSVVGGNSEEAILLARKFWAKDYFRTLHCGFRYTLPERDEHGVNALYSQMAASYASMNGIYFDPDLSCNCFVQSASNEARTLMKHLQKSYNK